MRPKLLALAAAAGLLAGCIDLHPKSDPTRYYVLGTLPPRTGPAKGTFALSVGRVRVPDYLGQASVAIREGNRVIYTELEEWAEPLDRGILRVLGANLATVLDSDRVATGDRASAAATRELQVEVDRFDTNERGQGLLVARWRILGAGGREILKTGQSRYERDAPATLDTEARVSLMSELLAALSRELAEAMRSLPATR